MIEERLYLAELLAIYGPLLTDKQQRCLELNLYEDLSLSEIGSELSVSRQAVHDLLHRAEQLMLEYEGKLHLAKRYCHERQKLTEIYQGISQLETADNSVAVADILRQLVPFTSKAQEE